MPNTLPCVAARNCWARTSLGFKEKGLSLGALVGKSCDQCPGAGTRCWSCRSQWPPQIQTRTLSPGGRSEIIRSCNLGCFCEAVPHFYPRQVLWVLSEGLPCWFVMIFRQIPYFSDAVKIWVLQQLLTRQSLSRIHAKTALKEENISSYLKKKITN